MQDTLTKLNGVKLVGLKLAFFIALWILGSVAGFLVFRSADATFSSLMRIALCCPVSIVGLLSVIFFPFLITAFAVIHSKPVLIYLLCFGKAALCAVCALSVYVAFGSSGWLAQILLMFSENCTTVVLWVLWLKYFSEDQPITRKAIFLASAICIAIGALDVLFVSPFAVSLVI